MKLRTTLALIAFLALVPAVTRAQMSEGERKATARAAYMEGIDLQDKGKPAEALARFEAAQSLFDAPTHLLHIAECQALTGKLVEASETYETLIRKPLGDRPPEVFVQAQEQAKVELAILRTRIPSLRVTVKPDAQSLENLHIMIDDRQMPPELVGIARPLNPGRYALTATASGWATRTPVDVEVTEKETRSVELTLQQGGEDAKDHASAPGQPPTYGAEPPPRPASSAEPSAGGFLLGVRPAMFVPAGKVANHTSFADYSKAGPGIGFDAVGRLRKLLIGATLEYASLGAPDAGQIPTGARADVSTPTVYLGALIGTMPNVDKVSLVADLGLGMRFLSRDLKINPGATNAIVVNESLSGLEVALGAGISIPTGPFRIVPKAGLALGTFNQRTCEARTAAATASCLPASDSSDAVHAMLQLGLGLYYHIDTAKKPVATSPGPAAASSH